MTRGLRAGSGVFVFIQLTTGEALGVCELPWRPAVGSVIELPDGPHLVTAIERLTGADDWLSTRVTSRPYGPDVRRTEAEARTRQGQVAAAARDRERLAWLEDLRSFGAISSGRGRV